MNWTDRTPKKTGWYWLCSRLSRLRKPTVVYFDAPDQRVYARGATTGCDVSFIANDRVVPAQWAGPLKHPPQPPRKTSKGKPDA